MRDVPLPGVSPAPKRERKPAPKPETKNSKVKSSQVKARVHRTTTTTVKLPLLGRVELPDKASLAYAAGVGSLVAVEILELPVAAVLIVGHLLVRRRGHSKVEAAIGEAFEEA